MGLVQTLFHNEKNLQLKKDFIIAVSIGSLGMYIPQLMQILNTLIRYGLNYWKYYPEWKFLIEIILLGSTIFFLNRNTYITVGAFILTIATTVLRLGFCNFIYSSQIQFIFGSLTLLGLNKAIKPISIISSTVLLTVTAVQLFSTNLVPIDIASNAENAVGFICIFLATYGTLLLPIFLLICSINPPAIHKMIKVVDGYGAVRFMLFLGGGLLTLCFGRRYYADDYLNFWFLFSTCWLPIMTVIGMNAVLVFQIPPRELVKTFFLSLVFAVGVLAMMGAAQANYNMEQKAERERITQEREERRRMEYLQKTKENILSWKEAGFSNQFTIDAARSMLTDGRITRDEYTWLVNQLLK